MRECKWGCTEGGRVDEEQGEGGQAGRDSASEKKAKMNEGWERAHDAEQNGLFSGLNTAP